MDEAIINILRLQRR